MFVYTKLDSVIEAFEWMAVAKGSIASAKSNRELGEPCLQPLNREKLLNRISFINILA